MADAPAVDTDQPQAQQTVNLEDTSPTLKTLSIELPESRISEKIETLYGNLRQDAVLPGFRRGRAPRRLLERRFSKTIRDDVKAQLLSESYGQAVEDHDLQVIGQPDIQDAEAIELPESGPMTYTVQVEVAPTVELPDFASLEVDRPTAEVGDEQVDQELERLRERLGQLAATEDAQIESGDYAQANVTITAGHGDEQTPAEPLLQRDGVYVLVHGEEADHKGHVLGIVVDDLGKRLIGKPVGHEETVEMTGPSGHELEEIRDQPITIKLTVTQVQRLEPASTAQVAEAMGAADDAALREQLKAMLEQRAQQTQRQEVHRQLREKLVDAVELDLPEKLTGRQIERMLHRQRLELMYQGKDGDELEQALAEARGQAEDRAQRGLKEFFVLDQAARTLEVEVQEAEINGQLHMMAMQQNRRPEKLRQELQQRGELEQLYLQIREHKTLDAITEQATVKDVDGGGDDAAESDDESGSAT
jgi:trigger factor